MVAAAMGMTAAELSISLATCCCACMQVRLHAIIDACHSGTVLDMPYICKFQQGRVNWVAEPPTRAYKVRLPAATA